MIKVRIAFYKAKTSWIDRLIQWWIDSPYSHVEIVLPGNRWFSSSGRDGMVRTKTITPKPGNWDIFDIDIPEPSEENHARMVGWCAKMSSKALKYDWWGIISFVISPIRHDKDKYFCSEICLEALQKAGLFEYIKRPARVHPGKLFDIVMFNVRAKRVH